MLRPEHFRQIRLYADKMGIPVQECIDEAIEDWLTIVAAARVSQNDKPDNVIQFIAIP